MEQRDGRDLQSSAVSLDGEPQGSVRKRVRLVSLSVVWPIDHVFCSATALVNSAV